jgi:MICOS complex subunit MIC60
MSCIAIHFSWQRNNLEQAAREVNQLSGAPKSVASDWLADVRAYLEVQQVVSLLNAHVSVTGLSFI